MAFVSARGVRFHVVDLGRDRGGAAPVVMLHGLFTGSAASWFFTVAPALARSCRVRLPDWRGHGMSERTPSGYDTATMADDLAALTGDLPPFAVAAHSYGAAVAVRFALSRPGRVSRLALIDPPFEGDSAAIAPSLVPSQAGRRSAAGRRTAALVEETSLLKDLAAEPAVGEDELRALGDLPVLSVVGADSPFRASGDLVGRALPGARRHVLNGGHDLHITARARLTPLLTDFLGETHGRGDRTRDPIPRPDDGPL
ncbi:alpha/beta fold hydrolase [Actinomadura barringtoniae]|uniref:Alpha/beta fold hydrolase n=1 Tax=Actinomadura barringtoniae TaxID=1427535 RepID=A0A939TBS6_9ACTN|nr:alpha/beta fold hydrolase [Actinomadura barringtoniae]MBO2453847.1 alpha/beta fold hydrolase [Actinomadura barringtoniae]